MVSAFLSYSAHDKDVARRLASDLKRNGIRVWFDEEQILAGDSISERVREGIRDSEFLLVLLSENSLNSFWVKREIETAFRIHGPETQRTIIPIRLDDSPLPVSLSNIRYLDLREYEHALQEILQCFKRERDTRVQLDQVIDEEGFASALALDTRTRRGPEFYTTAILGVLTLIVSIFTSWPSFQTAFGRVSKVYFDYEMQSITLPPGSNQVEVLRILEAKGVAPAGLRIRVINKGQIKADEVRVGASVDGGEITRIETNPRSADKPIWVDLSVDPIAKGSGQGRVILKNFVPEKPVTINLGYKPVNAKYQCDVVADGLLAKRVDNINIAPTWTLYQAFEKPISILFTGLFISFLVGVVIAASRNPRLRDKLISLVEAVIPMLGRMLRVLVK